MSTHNIGFYKDLTEIIFQLSSNTHLICISSSDDKSYKCKPDGQGSCTLHSKYCFLAFFNSRQQKK